MQKSQLFALGMATLLTSQVFAAAPGTSPTPSTRPAAPILFTDKDPLFSAAQSIENWWPADGHRLDLVGNRHATLRNGARFGPGRIGKAFTFDGVKSVVDLGLPAAPTPPTPAKAFTLMFWFRAEQQAGWQYLAFCWNDCGMDININENQPERVAGQLGLGVGYQDTHGKTWNNAVANFHPIDQWRHLAFAFDGAQARLFRDGILAGETPWTVYTPSDTPLLLGAEDRGVGVNSLKGQIEDVALFRRGLSAGEVAAVYEAQAAPRPLTITEGELQKFEAGLDAKPAPLAWYAALRLPSDAAATRAHFGKSLSGAAPDAPTIAAIIKALDADSYAERERASAALGAYGPAIAPALRAALAHNPTPEVTSRIEALLATPEGGTFAPEQAYAARMAAIANRVEAHTIEKLENGMP